MKLGWSVFGATFVVLIVAYIVGATQSNLTLQIFYAAIAVAVFVAGFRAKSMTFLFLSVLLFGRFFLENYQYQWSPIGQLAFGHAVVAGIVYFTVRGQEDQFLQYFPVLIGLQCIADLSYLTFEYGISYVYIHNALALIQMSAFIVLARSRRNNPIAKEDPIEELISKLTRNWAIWGNELLSWKKNTTI